MCPPKIRRSVKDYFVLYRSRKEVVKRLTADAIRYAIRQRKKGKSASAIASELGVMPRHVRRPLKAFFTKKATEAIRKKDPKWMEADSND